MSNAFTNFLSGFATGLTTPKADMKDYQHADRLYVKNTYARAPKLGFLYYVVFNINSKAITDKTWETRYGSRDVGLLVKRIDLPKFNIATEVVNQYNRKTVVQTKLTYANVNVEFHDDNSNISNDLWKNYYNYYYMDGIYGQSANNKVKTGAYADTKYKDKQYTYGIDNYQVNPFFDSIDIYVLHQKKFTQITLVNPLVTEWAHDSLNQSENGKILGNKMTVAYESVTYRYGKISKGKDPQGFAPVYYDTTPSPLSVSGGIPGTLFGENGIIGGAESIFGENGSLANAKSPLDYLGVALQTRNLAQGIGQLTSAGLQTEGYSILSGVLGNIQQTGNQPGGARDFVNQSISNGINSIKLFNNNSVNQQTIANPLNLTKGS